MGASKTSILYGWSDLRAFINLIRKHKEHVEKEIDLSKKNVEKELIMYNRKRALMFFCQC